MMQPAPKPNMVAERLTTRAGLRRVVAIPASSHETSFRLYRQRFRRSRRDGELAATLVLCQNEPQNGRALAAYNRAMVSRATIRASVFVLIVLAIYGWHRYYLVYLYMKNRDKQPKK